MLQVAGLIIWGIILKLFIINSIAFKLRLYKLLKLQALGPVRLITSQFMAKYDNREDHQSDFTDQSYGDP